MDFQVADIVDFRVVDKGNRPRTVQLVDADCAGYADVGAALFDKGNAAADGQDIVVVIARHFKSGTFFLIPRSA